MRGTPIPAALWEDLELLKEINEKSSRTGMLTTGMMSIVEDRKIALFFTGQKHAGNWIPWNYQTGIPVNDS